MIDVKFYRESIFGIHSDVQYLRKKINANCQNFAEKKQTFKDMVSLKKNIAK